MPSYDAEVSQGHLQRMVGYDKCKLSEQCKEEEDNERLGEGDKECCPEIMLQSTLLVFTALVYLLSRVALETIYPEAEEQY